MWRDAASGGPRRGGFGAADRAARLRRRQLARDPDRAVDGDTTTARRAEQDRFIAQADCDLRRGERARSSEFAGRRARASSEAAQESPASARASSTASSRSQPPSDTDARRVPGGARRGHAPARRSRLAVQRGDDPQPVRDRSSTAPRPARRAGRPRLRLQAVRRGHRALRHRASSSAASSSGTELDARRRHRQPRATPSTDPHAGGTSAGAPPAAAAPPAAPARAADRRRSTGGSGGSGGVGPALVSRRLRRGQLRPGPVEARVAPAGRRSAPRGCRSRRCVRARARRSARRGGSSTAGARSRSRSALPAAARGRAR